MLEDGAGVADAGVAEGVDERRKGDLGVWPSDGLPF